MKTKFTILICVMFVNMSAPAQQIWAWANAAGTTGDDGGRGTAVDPSGDIYACGTFESPTITFGSTTLTTIGTSNMFLVKYDPSGNVIWARNSGGNGYVSSYTVKTDAAGNAYVVGYFECPTIVFGTTTLTNASTQGDLFVVKYDPSGNVLWAKRTGGTGREYAWGLTVDGSGNAIFAGRFSSSTLTFGTSTLTNTGMKDIYIGKYDTNGNEVWAVSAGGTNDDEALGITTDATGNIYATGYFSSSSITIGTTTLTNAFATKEDIFIAKYDISGNAVWARSAGGMDDDECYDIAFDVSGNMYLSGHYASSSITFGSTGTLTNTTANFFDLFLTKYDLNGTALWAVSTGGTLDDYAHGLSVDLSGNSFVSGWFESSTITFGTQIVTNTLAGSGDVYIVKHNAAGNAVWAAYAGGSGLDAAVSNSVDATGNAVYVTGFYNSPTASFGINNTLTNGGSNDFFLALLYTLPTGTTELSEQEGILIYPNPSNGVFVLESKKLEMAQVEIYNVMGEKIYESEVNIHLTEMDLSSQAKGIYLVKVKCGEKIFSKKIIIQ